MRAAARLPGNIIEWNIDNLAIGGSELVTVTAIVYDTTVHDNFGATADGKCQCSGHECCYNLNYLRKIIATCHEQLATTVLVH